MLSIIPKKYWFIGFISLPVFILDQLTKIWVDRTFLLHESIPVIQNFFSLTYVRNRGAAFGMFANASEVVRQWALGIVPMIALLVVAMIYRNTGKDDKMVPIALSLVIGGAAGNMTDRFRLNYVIDFLDVYYPWNVSLPFMKTIQGPIHWPAFNVADSAICIGIGLMTFHMLFIEPKLKKGHVSHP